MAGRPPKRKKLEKTEPKDALPESSQKFYCCRCGMAYGKQSGSFPVSHSPMYRGSGHLPMCNDCIDKMFEDYVRKLGSQRAAMKRLCMKMDLYWSDSIYDMIEKTAPTRSKPRAYIGKTNIVRYIDKTYDDTVEDEERESSIVSVQAVADVKEDEQQSQTDKLTPEVIAFWGPGYTPEMYMELEQRRQYWMGRLPDGTNVDMGTEILIRRGCELELDINRDRLAGKSIEKSVSALTTVLGALKLKPEQKRDGGDAEAERTPMGVWIKRWEEERPVPEPDEELQDHDGVVRYITTWFLGHLCKMLGIRNTYCKMYEEAVMERVQNDQTDDDVEIDEDLFNDIFGNGADDE